MFDLKKVLALAASAVMCLSLAACGSDDDDDDNEKSSKKKSKDYSSAVELMEDVKEHVDDLGFKVKIELNMNIKMARGSQSLEMSMTQTTDGESDRKIKHAVNKRSTVVPQNPEKNKNETEEYYKVKNGEGSEKYSTTDGGATWICESSSDDDEDFADNPESFDKAELKSVSKGYEIRGKMSELGEANPLAAEDAESFKDFGIEDMEYIITINTSLEPVSFVVEKMDFTAPEEKAEEALGEGGTLTGDIEILMRYSDWGKVKEGDIVVPEKALASK